MMGNQVVGLTTLRSASTSGENRNSPSFPMTSVFCQGLFQGSKPSRTHPGWTYSWNLMLNEKTDEKFTVKLVEIRIQCVFEFSITPSLPFHGLGIVEILDSTGIPPLYSTEQMKGELHDKRRNRHSWSDALYGGSKVLTRYPRLNEWSKWD